MVKIVYLRFVIVSLITLSIIGACKKEEGCTDELSENFNPDAVIDDGSCIYARDKYLGTYNAVQACVYDGDTSYVMEITQGPNVDEIIFENFFNLNVNIVAKVVKNNFSFKDEQKGIVFEGDGYIVNDKVSISFEVCEAFYYPCSDPDYCTINCTKQ